MFWTGLAQALTCTRFSFVILGMWQGCASPKKPPSRLARKERERELTENSESEGPSPNANHFLVPLARSETHGPNVNHLWRVHQ